MSHKFRVGDKVVAVGKNNDFHDYGIPGDRLYTISSQGDIHGGQVWYRLSDESGQVGNNIEETNLVSISKEPFATGAIVIVVGRGIEESSRESINGNIYKVASHLGDGHFALVSPDGKDGNITHAKYLYKVQSMPTQGATNTREETADEETADIGAPVEGGEGEAEREEVEEREAEEEKTKEDKEKEDALIALMRDVVGGGSGLTVEDVKALIKAETEDLTKEITIKNVETGEEKPVEGVAPKDLDKILALAQARLNILLVGPAGAGKTHIARVVSEILDLPFYSISVSAGMSEAQLAGWLVPTGEGGRFEYKRSPFIKAYEEGGVFLLDELDAGDANTLTFINAALSNDHCPVPNREEKPEATKHPDFICIAAANTYGNGADRMYVGRNQLDAATLDRFKVGTVEMNYDKAVEKTIVRDDVLEWGLRVRDKVGDLGLRRIVSTRFLRDLSIMAKNFPELFGTPKQWGEVLSQDWSADERSKVGEVLHG